MGDKGPETETTLTAGELGEEGGRVDDVWDEQLTAVENTNNETNTKNSHNFFTSYLFSERIQYPLIYYI